MSDGSNGYEAVADEFMAARSDSAVGAATVGEWAKQLPPGRSVLDLGCGHGVPISQVLVKAGLAVYGVDASPSMIGAFRARFPGVQAECGAVEDSYFFGHTFDGVIAWGLVFLLTPEAQARVIRKVSAHLKKGGRFLFTSPWEVCQWSDNLTGRTSMSLGSETYRRLLEDASMLLVGEAYDEGENHYYFAVRP